jgi:hypothetical protein
MERRLHTQFIHYFWDKRKDSLDEILIKRLRKLLPSINVFIGIVTRCFTYPANLRLCGRFDKLLESMQFDFCTLDLIKHSRTRE